MSQKTQATTGFQLVLHEEFSSTSGHRHEVRAELLDAKRLQEIMEQYIGYYALGDSHTARAKRYDLEHFLTFLGKTRGGPSNVLVSDWTLQTTKDFISERLAFGEAPTTVSRRVATLKHFGRTIAERLPGYINPAREAKSPVMQQTRPKGLSETQIQQLRDAASDLVIRAETEKGAHLFSAQRNRYLLELLLGTGLRADEVRLLTLGQLSEDLSWLKSVKTKGKKFRNVYVPQELKDLSRDYLQQRAATLRENFPSQESLPPKERLRFPLLISIRGAELSRPESFGLNPKTIWRIISEIGTHVERRVGERIHPHLLRHTFAHGLLDSSKDVRLVAQALGHSDVRTTMRYTERSEEELAEAVEATRKNKT